jgi:hypothetical protein
MVMSGKGEMHPASGKKELGANRARKSINL